MMTDQDPRDALMLGRTIKTTGINVLRADPRVKIGGYADARVEESSSPTDGM
jgi:hypothetical protein